MLKKFESYIIDNTQYSFISHNNELSDSVVIDFDDDNYIARFTLWDDFSCMSEIIDIRTSEYKLNKRNEFSSFDELLKIFEIFNEKLVN